MSEWKTLKQETIEVGGNNFLEINLKQPPEGENYLIGFSKGWFTDDGKKRYKTNILFSREKKDDIIKILSEIDTELKKSK